MSEVHLGAIGLEGNNSGAGAVHKWPPPGPHLICQQCRQSCAAERRDKGRYYVLQPPFKVRIHTYGRRYANNDTAASHEFCAAMERVASEVSYSDLPAGALRVV